MMIVWRLYQLSGNMHVMQWCISGTAGMIHALDHISVNPYIASFAAYNFSQNTRTNNSLSFDDDTATSQYPKDRLQLMRVFSEIVS